MIRKVRLKPKNACIHKCLRYDLLLWFLVVSQIKNPLAFILIVTEWMGPCRFWLAVIRAEIDACKALIIFNSLCGSWNPVDLLLRPLLLLVSKADDDETESSSMVITLVDADWSKIKRQSHHGYTIKFWIDAITTIETDHYR